VSRWERWQGRLGDDGRPPELAPREEPPAAPPQRQDEPAAASSERDMRPAIGTRGEPGRWERFADDAEVALAGRGFAAARWSYLYKARDTGYAEATPEPGEVAEANRRMRAAPPGELHGPFVKGPVWTWEVPLYFWAGGVASGAGFVALACDVAGDRRSAAIARQVALAAVAPAPTLLIADLGRPGRFLNMLRIVKPRSPMNMGAWCLMAFSGTLAGGVAADQLGRTRVARALGAATAVLGGYLGSYTGVLLASTAVPLWARSRLFLGPIFVSTATATGAAAVRLVLVARGLPSGHATRRALGTVETAAIATELALSAVNERRVGHAAEALRTGSAGPLLRGAKAAVVLGLGARFVGRRPGGRLYADLASGLYLVGGLLFRFAWVYAGKASAVDHEAVVALAREGRPARMASGERRPVPVPGRRVFGEAVRRVSLGVEGVLRRG
jgi:formate-dependent nitrite reductase membrane component NrfD